MLSACRTALHGLFNAGGCGCQTEFDSRAAISLYNKTSSRSPPKSARRPSSSKKTATKRGGGTTKKEEDTTSSAPSQTISSMSSCLPRKPSTSQSPFQGTMCLSKLSPAPARLLLDSPPSSTKKKIRALTDTAAADADTAATARHILCVCLCVCRKTRTHTMKKMLHTTIPRQHLPGRGVMRVRYCSRQRDCELGDDRLVPLVGLRVLESIAWNSSSLSALMW